MSKALVKKRVLDPELRLAQAISEFEAGLPDDEKNKFKAQKQHRPKLVDVMRFTAEIDRSVSTRVGKRAYGPRFTSFLEGVQRFASIGDILVGGSQYLPACAVWTLVRFSLMSIVQYSHYIDKLSELFMQIGRSTPQFQTVSLLFPKSQELQASLTEYYILVVQLCHKIHEISGTSAFKLVFSSYNDTLVSFEKSLKTWADVIRDELNVQTALLARTESEHHSWSRALIKKERDASEIRHKEKQWLRFLDACSSYDYQTTWKQVRKSGSTSLHHKDLRYQEWKSAQISSTLVYSGKLGAGKSVLMANIVDDLCLKIQPASQHVAYFFCRHDVTESLRARNIIGCLLKQILLMQGSDQHSGLPEIPSNGRFNVDELSKTLFSRCAKLSKLVYLVVDGLDECDAVERDVVLRNLKQWQASSTLLLCISARWEPDTLSKFRSAQLILPVYSALPEQNPELESYILSEIDARLASGQLQVGDSNIISSLKEILIARSQGMFLWASLFINCICGLTSDQDILEELHNSPKSLSEVYQRLLNRHATKYKHYQEDILKLVCAAYRPLTKTELREALSVQPGETEWNTAKLSNNIMELLTCCSGLVIVDEEELSVRVVHESARQFLLSGDPSHAHSFSMMAAQEKMAQIITTYLNFSSFETRVSTTVASKVAGEAILNGVLSSLPTSPSRYLKPIALLTKPATNVAGFDISKVLADTAMKTRKPQSPDLALEHYAKRYWFLHSAPFLDTDSLIQAMTKGLLEKDVRVVSTTDVSLPLSWTISNGYLSAFEILINSSVTQNKSLEEAIMIAAGAGHQEMLERCLQDPDLLANVDENRLYCNLILQADAQGRSNIVRLLLDQEAGRDYVCFAVEASCQKTQEEFDRTLGDEPSSWDLLLRVVSKEWPTVLKPWTSGDRPVHQHEHLAVSCLDTLLFADCLSKPNICRLRNPGVLRKDVGRSLVNRCIPSEVQYACLNWTRHLRNCAIQVEPFRVEPFHVSRILKFLQNRLLPWLEAVALLGRASEMVVMISQLCNIQWNDGHVGNFLSEIRRFVLVSCFLVDLAPMQLHVSYAAFAPSSFKSTLVAAELSWLTRAPQLSDGWDVLIGSFSGGKDQQFTWAIFSPDERHLASMMDDEYIQIWDVGTRRIQQVFRPQQVVVYPVVFSPDGRLLASPSYDKTVKIWDVASVKLLHTLKHSDAVHSAAFSPDGKLLACASFDKTVIIWHPPLGLVQQTLRGHSGHVYAVAFSPDGTLIATGSYDKTIRLWQVSSGNILGTYKIHSYPVNSVVFSPDGRRLASISLEDTVKLFNLESGKVEHSLEHEDSVNSVSFSPDGCYIASASEDKTLKIWNVHSGVLEQKLQHSQKVKSVHFSHDGLSLVSTQKDEKIRYWDATLNWKQGDPKKSGRIRLIKFSHDGTAIASVSGDNIIQTWDVSSGRKTQACQAKGTVDWQLFNSGEAITLVDKTCFILQGELGPPPVRIPPSRLEVSGNWIKRDGHRLIWLPEEHRGVYAVYDEHVAIGLNSGDVLVLKISSDKLDEEYQWS